MSPSTPSPDAPPRPSAERRGCAFCLSSAFIGLGVLFLLLAAAWTLLSLPSLEPRIALSFLRLFDGLRNALLWTATGFLSAGFAVCAVGAVETGRIRSRGLAILCAALLAVGSVASFVGAGISVAAWVASRCVCDAFGDDAYPGLIVLPGFRYHPATPWSGATYEAWVSFEAASPEFFCENSERAAPDEARRAIRKACRAFPAFRPNSRETVFITGENGVPRWRIVLGARGAECVVLAENGDDARDEGIVTLAQVRSVPGRPPLLLRTYAVSNGLRRSIVFDRPDPWASTVWFATFCTNSLLPDGGWDSQWLAPFRERAARRIRVPSGGVAEFTVELPDDRRPRALLVPVRETGFRGRRMFCAAFPPELPDPRIPCRHQGVGVVGLPVEYPPDPRFEKPFLRLEFKGPDRYSYKGREYSFAQLRSALEKNGPMGPTVLLDLPDKAPAREWFRLRDLCSESGVLSLLTATDGAAVPIPNAMGHEWRWEIPDPIDVPPGTPPPPPDPFRPGRLGIFEDGSFAVDSLPCPAADLHERISEATDGGIRGLVIWCHRNAPYGSLRRAIGAYWDIGGISFWAWTE